MTFYPATDEGVTTTALFRRRVGHEVEIAGSYTHTGAFAEYLWNNGMGTPNRMGNYTLHRYRCRCENADEYPVHTTEDGTAPGGEHIIGGNGGVLFGSPAYMAAIGAIADASKATGGKGANGTGGHIHVSKKGLGRMRAVVLFRNLDVLWGQLLELAAGPYDEVRSNGCMMAPSPGRPLAECMTRNPMLDEIPESPGVQPRRIYNYDTGTYATNPDWEVWAEWYNQYGNIPERVHVGPWEADPRKTTAISSSSNAFRFIDRRPTIEFRLWNTTTSRWRLYMGAGVSAALVEAACRGRAIPRISTIDLLDHLDGLLTPDLVALVERQRAILRDDLVTAA